MKLFRKSLKIGLLFFLSPLYAQDEESVIKGRVVDEITQEPVYDAIILVKGTEDAVSSDSAGYYELHTNAKPPFVVNVSYEGYKTQDIDVYEVEPELNVSLRIGENTLSTVVIVGYDIKGKDRSGRRSIKS